MIASRRIIIAIFMGFFSLASIARGSQDTTLVDYICNPKEYADGGFFSSNLEDVLEDVVFETADNGYDYYAESPDETEKAYAHGACNGALSSSECETCLRIITTKLPDLCPNRYGARVRLKDCRLRNENAITMIDQVAFALNLCAAYMS
ncbi:hypothetical protein CDL15_Pgr018570 [Punica granatum]|uniref:Gnk2-homologous domain-containing protein n=1 Tax=Punica granatum TaxID=22663 RepID=A0A218X0K9_PUNGR|nr:hypothetical protein CDL15_Pgr018570 [Punica granatum]